MSKFGLLIEYDYCTGCFSCEVACQQEHEYPAGKTGIKVTEYVMQTRNYPNEATLDSSGIQRKPVSIDYLPFPTDLCDLCAQRTQEGEKPSCVKHCQAACMHYGPVSELAKKMENGPKKMVLFKPL